MPPPNPNQPPPPPQGVPRPAELLDRFVARLIDGVLLVVVSIVLGIVVAAILVGSGGSTAASFVAGAIASVLGAAINLGYFAYFETNQGATLGKQVMKLKVVTSDGQSLPDLTQSLKRNIFLAFGLAGVIPIIGGFIGGLASLVAVIMIAVGISNDTAKRQGWHDKFADETMVLKIG